MKNTYPTYYKKFACIAEKCSDTCCAGWAVVADAESLEKYRNIGDSFGMKIKQCLAVDEDGDTVFTPVNNRCPFLLDSGLCEMYIKLGHDSLCRTCRQYPRHITYFGARQETGISFSCPEAARIIMQSSDPIAFETEETDAPLMPTDIDPELYFTLLDARKKAIDILQDRNFTISRRICAFIEFSQAIDKPVRYFDYASIRDAVSRNYFDYKPFSFSQRRKNSTLKKLFSDLKELEMLDKSWKTTLEGAEKAEASDYLKSHTRNEWEYEHLMIYFVFRYFMTAVFDGDLLTKSKLAAVSFITITKLQAYENADKSARTKIIQRFSKEVEHSASNMETINKSMKKSRCYSAENLINIIQEK